MGGSGAGIFCAGYFETFSPAHFRAQMETTFFVPLNVTRTVPPVMGWVPVRPIRGAREGLCRGWVRGSGWDAVLREAP
jgi:NAD(P)-dependent dehydrogenase (short-subunit alcohol dehydrogenase family)